MTEVAEPPARRGSMLVVDDERGIRDVLRIYLTRAGHQVTLAESVASAHAALARGEFDVVITDLKLPDGTGLDVLDAVKRKSPGIEVVLVTAFASTDTAIAAMKKGAYDYLTKPFKIDEVAAVVERCLEKRALVRDNLELREELKGRFRLEQMVGKSEPMQRVFTLLRKVAPTRTSVLLQGESGTGKELVARALHSLSGPPRDQGAFVAINCGAIPEALLESELFGHVRGAFTGAIADRPGVFQAASGGTLFLDEIGELSGAMQVKILRALQERMVKPVGSAREHEVDVRVIAATHRDLETESDRGAFRKDLYYRLNVIQIHLPPLRVRRDDIPLLVDHFVHKHAASLGRPLSVVEPDALKRLCDYDYPGNVRELENIIERAVTLESTSRITLDALPELNARRRDPQTPGSRTFTDEGIDLDAALGDLERELLTKALDHTGGVRKRAAHLLRITFRSLRYRLAKLGIDSASPEEE